MPEPIIQRLPDTQKAIENKYRQHPDLLSNAPTPISNALLALDVQRAQRGQNPLSVRQTQLALQAASTGDAVIQPPDQSFFDRITSDFGNILKTIPRLPVALYKEAQLLPTAPAEITKAMQGGGNILDQLARVAEAPGVRLLPGAYIASNLDDPGELFKHPLYTALDVLPAKQLKVGGKTVGKRVSEPVKTALTPLGKQLGATRPGELVREAFGNMARDVSQMEAMATAKMRETAFGQGDIKDPLGQLVRDAGTLRKQYPSITEERRMELTKLMSEDDLAIRNLSGEELAFVNESRRITDELGMYGVQQGLLHNIDGEFYDPDTAGRILRARRASNIAQDYGDIRNEILNPSIPSTFDGEVATKMAYQMDTQGHVILSELINRGIPDGELYQQVGKNEFTTTPYFQQHADDIKSVAKEILEELKDDTSFMADDLKFNLTKLVEGIDQAKSLSGTSVYDKITDVTKKEYLKPGGKIKLIEGYAHALESQGIDASPIFNRLREYRNTKSPLKYSDDDFSTWWEANRTTLQPRRPVDLEAFIAQLTKHAKTDPLAARMLDHVKAGRFQEAQTLAKQAGRRKTYLIPDIDDLVYELDRSKRQTRYFNSIKKWDTTRVNRLVKRAERTESLAAPARFHRKIHRDTQQRLIEEGKVRFSADPNWDQIFTALQEQNYLWLSDEGYIPKEEILQIQNDIRASWKDLKAAGHDPVFVHAVSESQLSSIKFPRVLERVPRPTQTVKRSWNTTPTIDDISVALTHQGMEWLARRGSEEFINTVVTKWGKSQAELLNDYIPAARVAAKTPDDVIPVANRLMAKEWAPYNPEGVSNWPRPTIKRWSGEQVWLPKTVSNTIQKMHTPPGGRMTAITDPIMGVFRTSLLPLSPRWHVYNILGGGIMTTVGAGPQAWRFLKQAYTMAREGNIPEGVPRGIGTVPRDLLEWNERSIQRPLEAIFHYKGGQTLRRLYDEAQGARTQFGKAIDFSYKWNGIFDDMYRSMAYLQAESSAIKKGLSADQASKAGVELARKVFQQWDRMTPIERTVMRFIFPFYGWTSHIMKFAMQYPFDHPIRTAIVGSFARNELEDMGSGLGYQFLNMFFLGNPDENGNVKALSVAGMNPFADVANNFTFAGFIGQTNPLISTAFQTVGVDVGNGGPELFPNMQYDPETGRLKFKSPNPLMTLAESIFPQSRILTGFADSSSEFQQLLRTNPDAAGRLLLSQAGIPVTFRTVNVPQEIAKSELKRDESMTDALNNALKSGDWSEAEKYPNLRPVLDTFRKMQEAGELEAYTPLSAGQSAIGQAQAALATQLAALPGMSPRQTPTGQ